MEDPNAQKQLLDTWTKKWKISNKKTKQDDCTLLHYACIKGAPVSLIVELCRKGDSIEAQCQLYHKLYLGTMTGMREGSTPLHCASVYGHVEVVKTLLDHKAKIEAKQDDNWTSLHLACLIGHVEMVKALLDHKADIEAENNDCWTPLHCASYNGHVEVVKVLLDHKANIEANDNSNRTPLHWACNRTCRYDQVEVAKVLVQRGADVNHCADCKKFSEKVR